MAAVARPTLGPVAKRAALYVRVSSEEQVEGYSLDAQQRAGRAYCEAHGWELVREYRDEGRSARTEDLSKRPAFAQMVADAEVALFDVVIVHKLDHSSRNLKVTLDTLDRLNACEVAFVSISESMDFSTPIGKVILATRGAFAQYYSDYLSTETKKGKRERKAQGMYNGLLPFGAMKGEDGVPIPDPVNHPGLLLAFSAAAAGKSDREIAHMLNAAGYRTSGNRGTNPWSKDSVRPMLRNQFYLGLLPDGGGGWLPGRHAPMIDTELFEQSQRMRDQNRRSRGSLSVRRGATVYSLSGLARCGECGGPVHISRERGRARAYCYNRRQGSGCGQPSVTLGPLEEQLGDFLRTFTLPADPAAIVSLLACEQEKGGHDDQRRKLDGEQDRLKTLFLLGDISETEYRRDRERIARERDALQPIENRSVVLSQVTAFLADLSMAWDAATSEERNALARTLFERLILKNNQVESVRPRPEYRPFFALDYAERQMCGKERKRRDSNPRSRP
jgi:site-specific DNA recombinase